MPSEHSIAGLFKISDELRASHPGIGAALVVIRDVTVSDPSAELDAFVMERLVLLRRVHERDADITAIPSLAAYRRVFTQFGVNPKTFKPAPEALLRRALRLDVPFFSVNNVVNAYNITSAETHVGMAAYDLDRLHPPVLLRRAVAGETHHAIGEKVSQAVRESTVVYADRVRVVCRDLNYRDCEETKVTGETRNLLLLADCVPGMDLEHVETSVQLAAARIVRFAGGRITLTAVCS